MMNSAPRFITTLGMYPSPCTKDASHVPCCRFKASRETKMACEKRGLPLGLLTLLEEMTNVQPSKRPSIQKVVQKSTTLYVRGPVACTSSNCLPLFDSHKLKRMSPARLIQTPSYQGHSCCLLSGTHGARRMGTTQRPLKSNRLDPESLEQGSRRMQCRCLRTFLPLGTS